MKMGRGGGGPLRLWTDVHLCGGPLDGSVDHGMEDSKQPAELARETATGRVAIYRRSVTINGKVTRYRFEGHADEQQGTAVEAEGRV